MNERITNEADKIRQEIIKRFTDHEAEVKRFQDRIKEMEKEVVDLMLELQHKNTIIEDLYDKSKDRRPF